MQAKITAMVDGYENLVRNDLYLRRDVAVLEAQIKQAELSALGLAQAAGLINGKNAGARAIQEAQIVSADAAIAEIHGRLTAAQDDLFTATAYLRAREAEIKLTAAWLYSQARIG